MSGDTCATVKLIVELQENGIMRLSSSGRFLGRLDEDDEVNFKKLSNSSIIGQTQLQKAFDLACEDAADSQCPNECEDYECEKCKTCSHQKEFYEDTVRDIECWKQYYLAKAEANG